MIPSQLLGTSETGHVSVLFDRGDSLAMQPHVIPKGGFEKVQKSRGLDAFRRSVAALVPFWRTASGDPALRERW